MVATCKHSDVRVSSRSQPYHDARPRHITSSTVYFFAELHLFDSLNIATSAVIHCKGNKAAKRALRPRAVRCFS